MKLREKTSPLLTSFPAHCLSWIAVGFFLAHGVVHHGGVSLGDLSSHLAPIHHHCCAGARVGAEPSAPEDSDSTPFGENQPLRRRCPLCMALAGGGVDTPGAPQALSAAGPAEGPAFLPDDAAPPTGPLNGATSPRAPPLFSL